MKPTPPDLPYRFEVHQGVRILIADYRGMNVEESLEAFRIVSEMVCHEPVGSIRALSLVRGMEYNSLTVNGAVDYIRKNRPHVHRSAVVGLDHLAKILNIVNRLGGSGLRGFNDDESAKDWLTS